MYLPDDYPCKPEDCASTKGRMVSSITGWQAILYVSYNTVISIAILDLERQSRKVVWNGAVLGGLAERAVMIYTALSSHAAEIVDLEVPMVFIAGSIMPVHSLYMLSC